MRPESNDPFKETLAAMLTLILTAIVCVLLGVMLNGCSSTKYVPVERVTHHTDTLYKVKARVDSILLRDSVSVMQRGDTVIVTKYRDRLRYSERVDTVFQAVGDSVRVPVPYPVERRLSPWERTKQEVGGWAILAALVVPFIVAWLVKKYRK